MPLQALTFVPAGKRYAGVIDVHFTAAGQKNDYTTAGRHRQPLG
jgi:hypothetical protein